MKIKPTGTKVFIEMTPEEEPKTQSGIILTSSKPSDTSSGIIVATGYEVPKYIKPGFSALFMKGNFPAFTFEGKEYRVGQLENILGVYV